MADYWNSGSGDRWPAVRPRVPPVREPDILDEDDDPYRYVDDSDSSEVDDEEVMARVDAGHRRGPAVGAGAGVTGSASGVHDTGAGVGAAAPPPLSHLDQAVASAPQLSTDDRSTNAERRRRMRQRWQRLGAETDELYDPERDDKDEKWVARLRQRLLPRSLWDRKTDAVLSCPCCFTPLCIDCQRHERHVNQFRAMFVLNCRVVNTEVVKYRRKGPPERAFYSAQHDAPPAGEQWYHPVQCAECGTEVALLDTDEVYHFFSAIADDA